MIVSTQNEIDTLRKSVIQNAEASLAVMQRQITSADALSFFFSVKFDQLGHDPINGKPQNLIEQINQMYSDLVVLAAAEDLLQQHPGAVLELQLGSSAGHDIRSADGQIAAECFAVTSTASNRKMEKDCKKLMKSDAAVKCIYFYSHLDSDDRIASFAHKHPDIRFVRIKATELKTSTGS